MTFDDIGRVWREDSSGEIKRRRVEDLSDAIRRTDRFLGPLHRNGKWILILTVGLCVPVFTWGVIHAPRPELALPGSLMVGLWLVLMWLRWRQLRPPTPDSTRPVRAAVQEEVQRLRFLETFLGDVPWGMIALFLVGEILAFEGFTAVGAQRTVVSVAFYLLLVGIAAVVVFRNPAIARRKVRPLREDLESWLDGLRALESDNTLPPVTEGDTA